MKQFFRAKKQLGWAWCLLLYFGICLLLLGVSVFLQAGPMTKTFSNYLHEPIMLLLNLFPVAAILGFFWMIFGNLFYSASLSTLLIELISLVNLIKIECRKDPLVPADFGLLGEAMIATGEYRLNLHIPYIILIVLAAAFFFLCGLKFKSRPKPWIRWGCCAGIVALSVISMLTVYPS